MNKSGGNTANRNPFGLLQHNTMELKRNNSERLTVTSRQKFIYVKQSSTEEIKLNKSENGWISTVAVRDTLNKSGGNMADTNPSELLQYNTMELKRNNSERLTVAPRQKFIYVKESSTEEIELSKSENKWIPTVAVRKTAAKKTDAKSKRTL